MPSQTIRSSVLAALPAALLLGALLPGAGAAQSEPLALATSAHAARGGPAAAVSPALARGRYAVVIDLDVNRLFFRQGDVTLWSAPIGTGTGLRLETEHGEWDFSTPNGVYSVKYKEEDPVWIAPDWYFIENDLPVPPVNDPKRYFPGGLGAAAVYIDHDLAIHGTDKPELLGQRVSHGCIRLSNRDAQRLYHNVQVGTEVVIVGGEKARPPAKAGPEAKGNDPSTFDPAKPKPAPKDPLLDDWKRSSTRDLLVTLGDEMWIDPATSRWPEVVRLLAKRALDRDDDLAMRGLMVAIADLPNRTVEREYRTFLADVFARAPVRTLETLSGLPRRYREQAAEAIVLASTGLYGGELDAHGAPWPTMRVPASLLTPASRMGWSALERAERGIRGGGERLSID